MDNASNLVGKRDRQCLQPKPKCNVRKSLAWDSAFFTSPGMFIMREKNKRGFWVLFMKFSWYIDCAQIISLNFPSTCSGVLDPEELCQTLNLLGNEKKKMVTSEALEAEWTSGIGRYSLRKSLAWDSAFFTSAGRLLCLRNPCVGAPCTRQILSQGIYFHVRRCSGA